MQFVLPIIAIMILGVVEITANTTPTPTPTNSPQEQKETSTPTEEVKEVKSTTTQTTGSVKIIVTNTPNNSTDSSTQPKNYMYPGSSVTSESSSEIHFETQASTQEVTDWYKNYIRENNMNTTSFVTTNTNNNVLNRLVGANDSSKIDVEIIRNNGESITKVKILLNS